jgi:hypothetical protein
MPIFWSPRQNLRPCAAKTGAAESCANILVVPLIGVAGFGVNQTPPKFSDVLTYPNFIHWFYKLGHMYFLRYAK